MPSSHLVSGGARSGKSAYAEKLAVESGLPTTYLATAPAGDEEMRLRIERHRARRPQSWSTVECADAALGRAIHEASRPGTCTLVDCLTLWLANILAPCEDGAEPSGGQLRLLEVERENLLHAVKAAPGTLLVVTNEIGAGVTPLGRLSRIFVDEHGATNQRVAEACDRVTLMVCGIPLAIKPGASHRPT